MDRHGLHRAGALPLQLLEEVRGLEALRVAHTRRGRSGFAPRRLALATGVEARGDDRDHDFFAETVVEARPEDDVGLRVRHRADLLGGFRDFEQAQVGRALTLKQDALRAADV